MPRIPPFWVASGARGTRLAQSCGPIAVESGSLEPAVEWVACGWDVVELVARGLEFKHRSSKHGAAEGPRVWVGFGGPQSTASCWMDCLKFVCTEKFEASA